MSPLAAAFLTVHTPRYCTLEAALEGRLASEVFRPVRDGLVAQGAVVAFLGQRQLRDLPAGKLTFHRATGL